MAPIVNAHAQYGNAHAQYGNAHAQYDNAYAQYGNAHAQNGIAQAPIGNAHAQYDNAQHGSAHNAATQHKSVGGFVRSSTLHFRRINAARRTYYQTPSATTVSFI